MLNDGTTLTQAGEVVETVINSLKALQTKENESQYATELHFPN